MSKICVQFDKSFMANKDFIGDVLLHRDFAADEISASFNVGYLETSNNLDFSHLEKEIREVHDILKRKTVTFNLLLDSACWGGKNFLTSFQKQLDKFLNLVAEEHIALVLMEPAMINYISRNYPKVPLIISVSSSRGLFDFHLRCQFYEKYFAHGDNLKRIILPPDLNRDFTALKTIRNASSCELAVKVNDGDLFCSPFGLSEETSLAHINPCWESDHYKMVKDTFTNFRKELFLEDPWRLIASPWIRPEDMNYYESLGIDCFTIVLGGGSDAIQLMKVYAAQSYEGNIISLLREGHALEEHVFIDNRWLDGFVDRLLESGTGCIRDCEKCRICIQVEKLKESWVK